MSDFAGKALRTLRLTGETTYYASCAAIPGRHLEGICACLSGEAVHDALLFRVLEALRKSGEDCGRIVLLSRKQPSKALAARFSGNAFSSSAPITPPVPASRPSKGLAPSLVASTSASTPASRPSKGLAPSSAASASASTPASRPSKGLASSLAASTSASTPASRPSKGLAPSLAASTSASTPASRPSKGLAPSSAASSNQKGDTSGGAVFKTAAFSSPAGRRALTGSRLILAAGSLPEAYVPVPGQMLVCIFGKKLTEKEASVTAFPFDGRQRAFFHARMILAADAVSAGRLATLYGLRGIWQGRLVDASAVSGAALASDLLKGTALLPSAVPLASGHRRLLFYAGALPRNGITTSLKNLLRFLPKDIDAWLCTANVEENAVRPDLTGFERLAGFIDLRSLPAMTLAEQPAALAYFVKNADTPAIRRVIAGLYDREKGRVLPGISFDALIHFNGYGRSMMGLMGQMTGKKVIFVHNDLPKEIDQKGRQHLPSLLAAYRGFDHIAVVSEALVKPTRELAGEGPDIRIVPNCHDFAGIKTRARLPIAPDPDTLVTLTGWDDIGAFLEGHSLRLITIGRFSAEKNHALIIEAFERFYEAHPGTGLTIIGGYGDLYEETKARVAASPHAHDICLIRAITNPMPILSRCHLFVLASSYEGQPMVLAEAGCLGIPAIAAATRGSREFMEKWDGTLVEATADGLLNGFEKYLKGEVRPIRMDYDHYNDECLKAFMALIN